MRFTVVVVAGAVALGACAGSREKSAAGKREVVAAPAPTPVRAAPDASASQPGSADAGQLARGPVETTHGRLIGAWRSQRVKALAFLLSLNGVVASEDVRKAKRGRTFVVLEIDGWSLPKPPGGVVTMTAGPDGRFRAPIKGKASSVYIVDGAGTKFPGSAEAKGRQKGTADVAFDVPDDAVDLALQDGEKIVPLSPFLDGGSDVASK